MGVIFVKSLYSPTCLTPPGREKSCVTNGFTSSIVSWSLSINSLIIQLLEIIFFCNHLSFMFVPHLIQIYIQHVCELKQITKHVSHFHHYVSPPILFQIRFFECFLVLSNSRRQFTDFLC